jgi:hypothetical protein
VKNYGMRTVSIWTFSVFGLLGLGFVLIGGRFDKLFWLQFLPGLMENLLVLALAIFVIDRIFHKERLSNLRQASGGQSRFVLLQCNLLAFKLLEYLGQLHRDNLPRDTEAMFSFAMEKMKSFNIAEHFYQLFMAASDRASFLDGLTKIMNDGQEGLSKAIEKIYPYPSPAVKVIMDELPYSIAMAGGMEMLLTASREANEQVRADQRLEPQQIDLLLKIAYGFSGAGIQKAQTNIIDLARMAEANELFIILD